MILQELNQVNMQPVDLYETKIALANTHTLCRALRLCITPVDCIPLLHTELTNSNRRSFVDRIYGRMRALQPPYEMAQIDLWRTQWESKKMSSRTI